MNFNKLDFRFLISELNFKYGSLSTSTLYCKKAIY